MRTIKFRGKKNGTNEWLYLDLLSEVSNIDGVPCDFLQYAINPETIGQYCTISLKNFYDGDLVMADCSVSGSNNVKNRLCKVVVNNTAVKLVIWHKNEWHNFQKMYSSSARLIGNIFDNPELLKQ